MKRVAFSRDAIRALNRLPAKVAATIRKKIAQYASRPEELANNVKARKGARGVLRIRVGDWRVILIEDVETITIVRIAPRGSAYD